MNTQQPIRVALVEDDEFIRMMLIELLEESSGLRCVGGYADAESAIRDIPLKKPDVVLMDIQLPGKSGIDAISELSPQLPETDFIVFTVYEDSTRIVHALEAGAVGYLLKSASPNNIRNAILDVRNGGSPMSPQIARKVVRSFREIQPNTASNTEYTSEPLTDREFEILTHLSKGLIYKEIASELFISTETVHTHIRNIYRKMQVRSRTEAVIKFLNR